jgi:hypothetical protein
MIDSPGSIMSLMGCAVWLPISVWVFSLISWSIMGEIDAGIGLLGAALGIVVGVAIMLQPNEQLTPLLLLAVFSMVATFPALRSYHTKREFARLDIEAMENAYEQLSLRPGNLGSTMRIARIAYQRGWVAHAVAIAEPTLSQFPQVVVADDLREMRAWKNQLEPHHHHSMTCLECSTANPPGQLWCMSCRAPILLDHARGAWLGTASARRLVGAWLAGVASLVGIPLAASLLPRPIAAVFVVLFLALSAGVLWWAFRTNRRLASRS